MTNQHRPLDPERIEHVANVRRLVVPAVQRRIEFGGAVARPERREHPEPLGQRLEAFESLDDPPAVKEHERLPLPPRQDLRAPAVHIHRAARQSHAPLLRLPQLFSDCHR